MRNLSEKQIAALRRRVEDAETQLVAARSELERALAQVERAVRAHSTVSFEYFQATGRIL